MNEGFQVKLPASLRKKKTKKTAPESQPTASSDAVGNLSPSDLDSQLEAKKTSANSSVNSTSVNRDSSVESVLDSGTDTETLVELGEVQAEGGSGKKQVKLTVDNFLKFLEKNNTLYKLLNCYPEFVKSDIIGFLQYLKVNKFASSNTLLSYRTNLCQLLAAHNQIISQQRQAETVADSAKQESKEKIANITKLLAGRKHAAGSKGIDAYTRKQFMEQADEAELAKLKKAPKFDSSPEADDVIGSLAEDGSEFKVKLPRRVQKKVKSTQATQATPETQSLQASQAHQLSTTADLLSSLSSEETVESTEDEVNPYLVITDFSWDEFQSEFLRKVFVIFHQKGKSAKSRNQILSTYRSFFKWLLSHHKVKDNYPKQLKNFKDPPGLPNTVDHHTVGKILASYHIDSFIDFRDQVIFEIMASTGMRLSEICNLNLQDINWSHGEIEVLGKGNVYRKLPISAQIRDLLSLYLVLRERELGKHQDVEKVQELELLDELASQVNLSEKAEVHKLAQIIVARAIHWANQQKSSTKSSLTIKATTPGKLTKSSQGSSANRDQADDFFVDADLSKLDPKVRQDFIREKLASQEVLVSSSYALQVQEQSKVKLKSKANELHALFLSSHLRRISARAIQYRISERAKMSGIRGKISPHKLRHYFATSFLENSENLRAVQELLGHKNLSTTQIYTNLNVKHLVEVYNRSHPSQIKNAEVVAKQEAEREQQRKAGFSAQRQRQGLAEEDEARDLDVGSDLVE